jgi:hypothetical protein
MLAKPRAARVRHGAFSKQKRVCYGVANALQSNMLHDALRLINKLRISNYAPAARKLNPVTACPVPKRQLTAESVWTRTAKLKAFHVTNVRISQKNARMSGANEERVKARLGFTSNGVWPTLETRGRATLFLFPIVSTRLEKCRRKARATAVSRSSV